MTGFADRFIQQGSSKARRGCCDAYRTASAGSPRRPARRESADAETLLQWSERVLTARTLDEVVH